MSVVRKVQPADMASHVPTIMSTRSSQLTNPTTKRARIMQMVARVFGVFFRASETPQIDPQRIRKIVWIRLDHIGDVVMSLPSLQLLRENFPHAQIDIVIRPACKTLFDDLKLQDRVLVYDSPRFPQRDSNGRGRGAGLFRTLQFIGKLRRENYDMAIEPRGDDIARLLCWMSKTPIRIGPNRIFYQAADAPNLRFVMTHVSNIADEPKHAVVANCALLQPLLEHRVLEVPPFQFPILESRRERIEKLLQNRGVNSRFVVLHTCSNDEARNWTTANWAQIADYFTEQNLDVVLSGIGRDRETHREIYELSKCSERIHDFADAIALPDLPAFFSLSQLLVTVDTGPMHIAAFANTPIVALFLPHLAPRHAPFGQQEFVVLPPPKFDEPNIEDSLEDILVEDVTNAITCKLEQQ